MEIKGENSVNSHISTTINMDTQTLFYGSLCVLETSNLSGL